MSSLFYGTVTNLLKDSLIANIKYLDNDGKDLIFADTPAYPPESIKIYKTGPDDQPVPLMFTINKNAKFMSGYATITSGNGDYTIQHYIRSTSSLDYIPNGHLD